ncbi:metal ABC transporter ATP-binding protein [Sporolactobacillus vineae]|uniref:metal ABC transporter ATP-binding protein n=1 Tax=Sporolactobacillus vineae TaxID=444463 RepID=UPI0002881456|nr:ABC transporter ATP-binding protein [Sporolactobacillus vineae]
MLKKMKVSHLEVSFNGERVLNDLSFQMSAGEMLAVIGPNGAGKSTLLKAILGVLRPQHGTVLLDSGKKRTVIGYVPQSRAIDEETPVSARDFVSLGQVSGFLPWHSASERQTLKDIMAFTDTLCFASKPVGRLSGGERQRAFLAQALVRRPDLLLLDESTASLDPEAQIRVMDLVRRAARDWGVAVIFISHDLHQVEMYADRVLLMARDFSLTGDQETILNDPALLKKAYHSAETRIYPESGDGSRMGDVSFSS